MNIPVISMVNKKFLAQTNFGYKPNKIIYGGFIMHTYQHGMQQVNQCRQQAEQLIQQTQQGSQQYKQMLQQEQQNVQMLEQLIQRERQAVQYIQQSLQGHDQAINQCQQIIQTCNQMEQELRQINMVNTSQHQYQPFQTHVPMHNQMAMQHMPQSQFMNQSHQ